MRSACRYDNCLCPPGYDGWTRFVLQDGGHEMFAGYRDQCRLDESSHLIIGSGINQTASFGQNYQLMNEAIQDGRYMMLVTERMVESMLIFQGEYDLHLLDVAFLSKKVKKVGSSRALSNESLRADALMREWQPYDTKLHNLANKVLNDKMEQQYPNASARDAAIEVLSNLNDLLYHTCSSGMLKSRQPDNSRFSASILKGVSAWCREKELDNLPWNRFHLDLLNRNKTHSYDTIDEAEEGKQ